MQRWSPCFVYEPIRERAPMPDDPVITEGATDEQDAEIIAGATPGPWWWQSTVACYLVIEGGDRTSDQRYLAMMGYDVPPGEYAEHESYPNAKNDARFIERARTAWPEERAKRIAAEAEVARLRLPSFESMRRRVRDAEAEVERLNDQLRAERTNADDVIERLREALHRIDDDGSLSFWEARNIACSALARNGEPE